MPKIKNREAIRKDQQPQSIANVLPLAYRVADAARVLGVGKTSLYELFKSGELVPVRIAGRTLVPADQLRRLLAEAPDASSTR